jgi:hypothetical protein
MLSAILLAATCAAATPQYGFVALRTVRTIDSGGSISTRMGFASDDQYDYLATPEGLFRATSLIGAPPERVTAAGDGVNAVAVNGGALYVLREGREVQGPHATVHTLLRSTDHGATFTNIDAGLEDCYSGYCLFLSATQIEFAANRLFLGAGGNVLVSSDNGSTWKILHGVTQDGGPAAQTCPAVFHRLDQKLLIGGECPLDMGFMRAGQLRSDLIDWTAQPQPVTTPEMENRNVQFIRSHNGAVFSGIEGALMKSCDAGATFKYVIHYPLSGTRRYPYIHQFLAPARYPGLLIVGGFDKAQMGAHLSWSADGGETWTDASSMIPAGAVALLAEGRDGKPFVVVQEEDRAIVMEIIAKKKSAGKKWSKAK